MPIRLIAAIIPILVDEQETDSYAGVISGVETRFAVNSEDVNDAIRYPSDFLDAPVKSPLFSATALSIYVIFFSIGVIGALVIPSFSLFLAAEIKVRPFLVGLPFAGIAIASIIYNTLMGSWSDSLKDRRKLIMGLCSLMAVACFVFAFSRNYLVVALVATCIFSLSMVCFSQMLAYSLDYAETQVPTERTPLFNAIVRAQIALAWVIGPPLGFILASHYSFTLSYGIAGVLAVLLMGAIYLWLPAITPLRHQTKAEEPAPIVPSNSSSTLNAALLFCVVGFSLFWGANNAYLIGLPIHFTENLGLDPAWMGWVMGATAAFEVPFMLLAGFYAARIPLMRLINAAGFAALVLYLGIYMASELWHFFVLQIFNAAFIGILAGLGVSVVQQLLPGQPGKASAIYTNTTNIGNLISSLMVSVVADLVGYGQIFIVNVFIVMVAIVCFSRIKLPSQKAHPDKQ